MTRRQNVSITTNNLLFNATTSKLAITDNFNSIKLINLSDAENSVEKVLKFDSNVDSLANFSGDSSGQHFLCVVKNKVYVIDWNTYEIKLAYSGNLRILKWDNNLALLEDGKLYEISVGGSSEFLLEGLTKNQGEILNLERCKFKIVDFIAYQEDQSLRIFC